MNRLFDKFGIDTDDLDTPEYEEFVDGILDDSGFKEYHESLSDDDMEKRIVEELLVGLRNQCE